MLLTKSVKKKIRKAELEYYREKGYKCEVGETIKIKTTDLQEHSSIKVTYACDCCGKEITLRYEDYFKKTKRVYASLGVFCDKCNKAIRTKWYKENDPDTFNKMNKDKTEKAKKTVIERYGKKNVMQVEEFKDKLKETMTNKYGVDNPMKVPEFRQKLAETLQASDEFEIIKRSDGNEYITYKKIPVSQNQYHFWELYGGKLNELLCYTYSVDILLENNIYFEYNGTGHSLSVKLGKKTKEEFQKEEAKRYYILKQKGYKQFVFKSETTNNIPNDDVLLKIKEFAFDYLSKEGHNWIEFDYDNYIIKTKEGEIDFNF